MIIWNWPSECPKCGSKEFFPTRPLTRIPPPWEQSFECRDESCKHGWAIKKVTSPPVNAYIIHAPKVPKKVQDGEVRRCSTFLVFSPSAEEACAVMGLDGDKGDYEFVDCYELMALWDRTNQVLKERGPNASDHPGGLILGGG